MEIHRASEPVNLRQRFGHRFKIEYEESYYAENGSSARRDDPWLQTIACRHGHVFPWGGDFLAANTDKSGSVANKLRAMDCCKIVQDGTDGITVTFHVDDFRGVALVMKPRFRRRLTKKQREAAAERLKEYRYRPHEGGSDR